MNKKMLISIAIIIVMLLNYILPISLAAEAVNTDTEKTSTENTSEETSDSSATVTPSTNGAVTFNSALYNGLKSNLLSLGIQGEFNDGQRTMKLSQEDINKVTTLKLSNYGISDLTGLDIFKNVTYIDLSANELDSDSNLEVLNSMNLNFLDLSSNQISDVSMITNINSIPKLNLHNQKFDLIEIIEIDTEVESDQKTEVTFALPQVFQNNGTLKLDSFKDTSEAAEGSTAPRALWRTYDGKNITLQIGESTSTSYTPYYGMLKISLEVDDSTNTLYNSKINLYYITVSSEERGIIFKDDALYKAVKKQLTKAQKENEDLTKYTETSNLYERTYDEPKVMVVSIGTLINKIPSLNLSDKKITDLTGIEKFVGLEKELNLEGNYIEDIDKVIELKANKIAEQTKLQTKVSKQISYIKESVDAIDAAQKNVETEKKKIETLQEEISKLNKEISSSTSGDTSSKSSEVTSKQNEIDTSLKTIATNQNIIDTQTSVLKSRMAKLYEIYKKSYKFTKVATVELATLTEEEFSNLTYESAKSIYEKQVSRFSTIESTLTSYESQFIIDCYSIPTVVNTTVKNESGTDETKTVDIENPISTYFKEYTKNNETYTLADMKSFLTNVTYISTILEMMNYCTLERLYNGTTTCYDEEFLTATTAERILNNQSTEDLEKISSNLSTIKSTFSSKYSYTCEGSSTFSIEGDVYKIAGKFAATTADEVSAYVTIPMLKILNIKRNLVESIDGIEELNELQELYVGDNELVSVDSVDWSKLTDLKILDLSYNDLSEIKCLEVISSLEDLDLSKNLIKGAYNFGISGMKKLQKLNLSYNAIDDISLLEVQLAGVARDAGYSDVAEYLEAGEFDIEFYGQVLTMDLDVIQMGSATYVDLPNIFRQAEELDSARTSFGTNSIFGNVTNDGKQALLDSTKLGEKTAQVSIVDTKYGEVGICSGTYCTINYTVKAQTTVEPDNSDSSTDNSNTNTPSTDDSNTNNPSTEDPTTKPDDTTNANGSANGDSTNPSDTENGYTISGDVVKGVSPKTGITEFAKKLTSDYNVLVVKENEDDEDSTVEVTDGYVATGMIAIVYEDEDNIIGVYEIVVKGDVNGDGVANAADSNLIKAYRSEIMDLTGVYKEAADINQDGVVNAIDSRLLLYHRAEINGYVL